MYAGRRGSLAALILDEVEKSSCPVPMSEITSVFSSRWGRGELFSGLGQFDFGEIGRASCRERVSSPV